MLDWPHTDFLQQCLPCKSGLQLAAFGCVPLLLRLLSGACRNVPHTCMRIAAASGCRHVRELAPLRAGVSPSGTATPRRTPCGAAGRPSWPSVVAQQDVDSDVVNRSYMASMEPGSGLQSSRVCRAATNRHKGVRQAAGSSSVNVCCYCWTAPQLHQVRQLDSKADLPG